MNPGQRRGMAPEDITRIRWVSDVQISPDGERVAFVVTTLSEERDAYLANVWMVVVSGGEPRRLTSGDKRDGAPRWSPDGRRLAFVSERQGDSRPQLYVMPTDGGEAVRLTEQPQGVSEPVWSPEGKRLAFLSRVGGDEPPQKEAAEARSRPARVITTLKYKMNGEGFVYDRRTHVFVVDADNGSVSRLTGGDYNHDAPAWSPDGRLLAFTSARHAERDEDDAADVWVMSADGGDTRCVTDTTGPAARPSFSPDGRTIAYLGHAQRFDAGYNWRMFTVPAAGGASHCVSAGMDRSCLAPGNGRPLWSADGQRLWIGVQDRGDVHVCRFDLRNPGAPEVVLGGSRQVTGLSAAADGGRLAFSAMDPTNPAEVFVCEADGSGERRLTRLNADWQAGVELAAPQRLDCVRDGCALDVWVMKPHGFEPGKRYPLLLNIHGGPHMMYGNDFFDEFQVYSGAGYVVLYANPRGSRGYGESFTRAVIGDWGGVDHDDLSAALDAALEQCDYIDAQRLGVMGGSYGGYLTTWAVGHSDRFSAACSERAVNNVHTLFGTSDIGHSFAEAQSGCLPWDNLEWYVERSPLTYVSDITTPLLIIHAEDDLRCPIEQAEQLFTALKKQRKEVRFVRFPDEGHDMSRAGKPLHRLERFRLILEWFDGFLQPSTPPSQA
ncbi:MAG: S9 family peptidase [Candidatus Tectomicrobia bacterium]|nr:S9 family peptidase [Candidatus Tectomicrobia bacterium]